MSWLCRNCFKYDEADRQPKRCPACGSPRIIAHDELLTLNMAHVDCDAFFASVEKRDDPSLLDKPLIIGGGQRGVVSTCCYLARAYGVKSAMPMFKAMQLCPKAVVIPPNMKKYSAVSRDIRVLMDELTPLVQPLSIDEAFMDMSGTSTLHKAPAAAVLAKFAKRVDDEIGVSISVGLSHNKFLAKSASDLDKPRGFSVIGEKETVSFLAEKPISFIFGIGKAMENTLAKDGLYTIAQLQRMPAEDLMRRYGETGARLSRLAFGRDNRPVMIERETKSVSSETTFNKDLGDFTKLSDELMALCEKLSERLKKQGFVGDTVTLKLKTGEFKSRTRAMHLNMPTQLAGTIYETGVHLLARECDGTLFRLIGIGMSGLAEADGIDYVDLIEPERARKAAAERAIDKIREKFGRESLVRGQLYKKKEPAPKSKEE